MTTQRSLAVLDIDGTVADVSHRRHLLDVPSPTRWNQFFASANDDPLLVDGAELAQHLATEHQIIWITGRPERMRSLTEEWLRRHDLPVGPLLMQPEGDDRPARFVKLEQTTGLLDSTPVHIVVDDDPRVVSVLQAHGVPVQLASWAPWQPSIGQLEE